MRLRPILLSNSRKFKLLSGSPSCWFDMFPSKHDCYIAWRANERRKGERERDWVLLRQSISVWCLCGQLWKQKQKLVWLLSFLFPSPFFPSIISRVYIHANCSDCYSSVIRFGGLQQHITHRHALEMLSNRQTFLTLLQLC